MSKDYLGAVAVMDVPVEDQDAPESDLLGVAGRRGERVKQAVAVPTVREGVVAPDWHLPAAWVTAGTA